MCKFYFYVKCTFYKAPRHKQKSNDAGFRINTNKVSKLSLSLATGAVEGGLGLPGGPTDLNDSGTA